MPADHRVGRDDRSVLAPTDAEPASQEPEQLVPGVKPSPWSGSSRPGQDGELMAQQQVLEHDIVMRARPGQHGRDQQPQEFKHASES